MNAIQVTFNASSSIPKKPKIIDAMAIEDTTEIVTTSTFKNLLFIGLPHAT